MFFFVFRYVKDLEDCIKHYLNETKDGNPDLPPGLRGQQHVIFSNYHELYKFHR